jgi:PEP-CTERM motif
LNTSIAWKRRFLTVGVFGFAVASAQPTPAKAVPLLAGPVGTSETASLSFSTIAIGGTDTLDVKLTLSPGANAAGVFGSGTVTFLSGDSQQTSVTHGLSVGVNDFTFTFAYANPGIFIPSFHLVATVAETANAGYTAPDPQLVDITANFGTLQVGAVPEPSTWALMILGFCGLGFIAHRKRTTLRVA